MPGPKLDLTVKHGDIIVTLPGTSYAVTYCQVLSMTSGAGPTGLDIRQIFDSKLAY